MTGAHFEASIEMNSHVRKRDSLLSHLLLITGFFMLLETSFFIQCARTYLFDFEFVSKNLDIPFAIVPGIVFFIAAQLLVHLSYALIIWLITFLTGDFLDLSYDKKLWLGVFYWTTGIATILVANEYYYPNSAFSDLMTLFLSSPSLIKLFLVLFLLFWATVLVLTLFGIIYKIRSVYLLSGVLILSLAGGVWIKYSDNEILPPFSAATTAKPNIILIGMDSLRPDFLGFFGHDKPAPFIDGFLDQSTVFSDAVTPLARTFPSWTGILSGRYPKEMAIRSNLVRQDESDFSQTLPSILRHHGYQTIYATDETRFSNIDKNFGFDDMVTPPIGLNDFLIGTFNDFPLSNLILNTRIGEWLFPYSYGNRPAASTYEPDSFLNMLKPAVLGPHDKPLFLAVHFCLTHFPYHWAGLAVNHINVQQRYEAGVTRVDQQVADFFALLKRGHLLDHAVVVLLSDHGEALELNGDRITEKSLYVADEGNRKAPVFYPPGMTGEEMDQSGGHGTDVMGLPQYHSLLAFRTYGLDPVAKKVVPGVVSLLDIKPTILSMLKFPSAQTSGISLAQEVMHPGLLSVPERHIFLESDFSPESIRTVYPETRKVILEGVELFRIDPVSARLVVKDNMESMIIRSKQYADIYKNWMLALYPQDDKYRMPVLINLFTGEWTNDLNSELALHSPARTMLAKLKAFYGNEIGKV